MPIQQMLLGAGAKKGPAHIDDVFKSYIYTGTGSARSVTTGIDMTDSMLWIKERGSNHSSQIMDTERGAAKGFTTDSTNDESNLPNRLTSFNSNGFSLGTENNVNQSSNIYTSWSFKKQEKFFDIVTYTGDGTSDRQISHSINGTVGCMMIKNRSDDSTGWVVFHRGVGSAHGRPLTLNSDAVPPTPDWSTNSASWFGHTTPADDEFTVGNNDRVNKNGSEFVCYLFADSTLDHTSPVMNVFGPTEDQHLIDCGQIVNVNASSGQTVTLDFEPQWLLIKSYSHTGDWILIDSLRGAHSGTNDSYFKANTWYAEVTGDQVVTILPNGFKIEAGYPDLAADNTTDLCYIAIAAETGKTMKAIEDPTKVFAMDTGASSSTIPNFDSGFPVDFGFWREPASNHDWYLGSRLTGDQYLIANTGVSQASMTGLDWDSNVGWTRSTGGSGYQAWMWKRHAGFDVVTYIGNDANRTINHNLGQAAEMMIVKRRTDTRDWFCYHTGAKWPSGAHVHFHLNENHAVVDENTHWQDTDPSATHFSIGTSSDVNQNGEKFLALLFASVSGVSKVGYYTGASTPPTINLGFAPRFLMIKNMDSAQNWAVLDTVRGLGSGNDPILKFNSSNGQETGHDIISTSSTGFTPAAGYSTVNGNGHRMIYYAHA